MINATKAFFVLLIISVPAFAADAPAPPETRLLAVGDVMLGRYIAKVMKANGSDYPFQRIAPVLKSADIVLGNLEGIIAPDDAAISYPDKPYSFHGPKDAAPALAKAGFTVLDLANNHAMDYGPEAFGKTMTLLQKEGIATFGGGKDIADARKPAIVTKNGVRFGFLGYGVAHSRKVYAAKKRPGIAFVEMEMIRKDVQALRKKVDILIVSLHWGTEYDTTPSALQREEAHKIVDWGADAVVGHHPHVMQGLELYKGRPIAYSLGNFVFDQKKGASGWSAMLACTFRGKDLVSAELAPLARFRTYFPVVAEGKARDTLLAELKRLSAPLNGSSGALAASR